MSKILEKLRLVMLLKFFNLPSKRYWKKSGECFFRICRNPASYCNYQLF